MATTSLLRGLVQLECKRRFLNWFVGARLGGISGSNVTTGKWLNVQNHYLGLQFSINGQTHYGWARFTVTLKSGIVGTLTGYAYETIPNKRILAGQTSGPDVASTVALNEMSTSHDHRPTLGLLARGADALTLWRRDSPQECGCSKQINGCVPFEVGLPKVT
jgi:hypothetical protein